MKSWIVILIVCLIYSIIIGPIAKWINKKVKNKWVSFTLKYFISCIIIHELFLVADMLGFGLSE
jgi:uncharacterized Tic20 family protein